MAETTTTISSPRFCESRACRATWRIRSTDPTEVPPNFWTIRAIGANLYRAAFDDKSQGNSALAPHGVSRLEGPHGKKKSPHSGGRKRPKPGLGDRETAVRGGRRAWLQLPGRGPRTEGPAPRRGGRLPLCRTLRRFARRGPRRHL